MSDPLPPIHARIDQQIAERAPWLYSEGRGRKPLRRALETLLSYDTTVALAQQLDALDGPDIMDALAARLAQNLHCAGLHRIPETGPALLICNHPTGIADAVMLWAAIRVRRPDAYFFANRDILRVVPQMEAMIAPVEWRETLRSRAKSRETLLFAKAASAEGRLGIIFPSGRLAYRNGLRLRERPWMTSAAALARKLDLPLIPASLRARNSALFYTLSAIHPTLRDITLFHETLNKDRQSFHLRIQTPIAASDLPRDPSAATQELRARCLAGPEPSLLTQNRLSARRKLTRKPV